MTADPQPPEAGRSDEGILLTFPKGLLGFEKLRFFQLLEPPDGYPLKFLQSTESSQVSFICIDPVSVKRDYEVPLTDEEAALLALETPQDALILTLVVVPEDPKGMTTNLAGPLVVNVRTRVGLQLILSSETYPLRCPILVRE